MPSEFWRKNDFQLNSQTVKQVWGRTKTFLGMQSRKLLFLCTLSPEATGGCGSPKPEHRLKVRKTWDTEDRSIWPLLLNPSFEGRTMAVIQESHLKAPTCPLLEDIHWMTWWIVTGLDSRRQWAQPKRVPKTSLLHCCAGVGVSQAVVFLTFVAWNQLFSRLFYLN